MTDGPSRRGAPKILTTGQYVALVLAIIVGLALAGAAAQEFAERYAGATGLWAAHGLILLVVLALAWAINRSFGNPTITIVCAVLVGLAIQPLGEELARPYGRPWLFLALTGSLLLGYVLWFAIAHRAGFGVLLRHVPAPSGENREQP